MREQDIALHRRDFIKEGTRAAAAVAVLSSNTVHAAGPEDKKITLSDAMPTRVLGKTGVELPILSYGGAALPRKWGNTLSYEDRALLAGVSAAVLSDENVTKMSVE